MFKSIRLGAPAARPALTVVGVFADERDRPRLPQSLSGVRASARARLEEAASLPGFKADAGETAPAGPDLILLGLGKASELNADTLRTIGARLLKRLDRLAPKSVRLVLGSALPASQVAHAAAGRAFAEGMALANWRVDFFAGAATKQKPAHPPLSISGDHDQLTAGLKRGLELAESVNYARRLAATPPNICNPKWIAAEAKRLARDTGLTCRVLEYAQAKKLDMGGICAVGQGSHVKPCLVMLEHKPARRAQFPRPRAPRARSARGGTLVLIGKTITYDTGGRGRKHGERRFLSAR